MEEATPVGRIAEISWITVRGIAELAIMVYVLNAISDPNINLIVALFGIIYASIRNAALGLQYLVCLLYVFSNLPVMVNTE